MSGIKRIDHESQSADGSYGSSAIMAATGTSAIMAGNLRESVIKAMERLAADLAISFAIIRTETMGMETADQMKREQISIGNDGADKIDGNVESLKDTDCGNGAVSTENMKKTVSGIDGVHQKTVLKTVRSEANGPSEDMQCRMRAEIEFMDTLIQLIDDEIEKMDNGRSATLLKDKKVTEDESQCSNSTPTEFVGIPMEPISSTPRSVKTDAVSMNGISEVKELIISMDSTKIERKGNEIGIQAESEEMRRGIRENGNETMSGFEPTGIAVISRTSTVYVLSLSFSLSLWSNEHDL